jgi:hypothetical protein
MLPRTQTGATADNLKKWSKRSGSLFGDSPSSPDPSVQNRPKSLACGVSEHALNATSPRAQIKWPDPGMRCDEQRISVLDPRLVSRRQTLQYIPEFVPRMILTVRGSKILSQRSFPRSVLPSTHEDQLPKPSPRTTRLLEPRFFATKSAIRSSFLFITVQETSPPP